MSIISFGPSIAFSFYYLFSLLITEFPPYAVLLSAITTLVHYYVSVKLTFPFLLCINYILKCDLKNWRITQYIQNKMEYFRCFFAASGCLTDQFLIDDELNQSIGDKIPASSKAMDIYEEIKTCKSANLLTENLLKNMYLDNKFEIDCSNDLKEYIRQEALRCRMNSSSNMRRNSKFALPLSKSTIEWL
jgi:hypothetical protein